MVPSPFLTSKEDVTPLFEETVHFMSEIGKLVGTQVPINAGTKE